MAKWTARIPGGFIDLIRRLGITLPPGAEAPFELTGNVVPVVFVDPLSVVTIPPVTDVPASAGELAGVQAAGTVLADTGPLAPGSYYIRVTLGSFTTSITGYRVRRSNPVTGTIWNQFGAFGSMEPRVILEGGFKLENTETINVTLQSATVAGDLVQANIFVVLLG